MTVSPPTPGQPRVIRLGPRPRAADVDAHRPPRSSRLRRLAAVPAVVGLVVASLLWPFLVLAPLAGPGQDEVRLVQDHADSDDLGVALGPAGASPVTAQDALVVDQASATMLTVAPPGVSEPGTVLNPSVLAASGIPEVALRAYRAAAATLAATDPACHLPWWLLAGIGRVESAHGQFAGAVLLEDGTSSPPIIGIPLDGRPGVATILDTDGGLLDGDTVYDRAVGPMQFIPSTWAGSQVDGDGDGVADPHDIDDAALASGRYLCAGGGDLSTDEGLRAAVFRYNHSDAYVDLVLAIGAAYATGTVPVIPVGDAPVPTASPTTTAPTASPTTTAPPTDEPTTSPTAGPTGQPTQEPAPTCTPTGSAPPTTSPSDPPTGTPSAPPCGPCPSGTPTGEPTGEPSPSPTCAPTEEPTQEPTDEPTQEPTDEPTQEPTSDPTGSPTP